MKERIAIAGSTIISIKSKRTMTQISACLVFNGNCREAMTFYQQCLSGTLQLLPVHATPVDPNPGALIAQATLRSDTMILTGWDNKDADVIQRTPVTLSLMCSGMDEINRFFNALANGGQITERVETMVWGGTFGRLTDKFGISWRLSLLTDEQMRSQEMLTY